MRSITEGAYFEVLFQELGVKVWIASESDANNGDNAIAKLMRSLSGFRAEGSNEERISKAISGATTALKAGRYPFAPKPGTRTGIPEVHPVRGPALRDVLVRIAEHRVTPTQGLIELNRSGYTQERAKLKMDKFRKIATDPFYAGIVEIKKQVNVRNINGEHDPLITLAQHEELLCIFTAKKKNQSGPRKNSNPEYPLNAIAAHDTCLEQKNKGKFVGYNSNNGKNLNLIYKKYRCRTCNFHITRDEMHLKIHNLLTSSTITREGSKDLINALDAVWRRREAQAAQDRVRINLKINTLETDISNRAIAAIKPSNSSIKEEILKNIEQTKKEVSALKEELSVLNQKADADQRRFMEFALKFINNLGGGFLSLTPENVKKCKQVIFPAGFYVDNNKNVYTPEISPLYRLATNKKDLPDTEKSHMVRVRRL